MDERTQYIYNNKRTYEYMAYKMGVPASETEDCYQTILLKSIERPPEFDKTKASIQTYATTFAKFNILDYLRILNKHKERAFDLETIDLIAPPLENNYEVFENNNTIKELIKSYIGIEREIYQLLLEGYEVRHIREALGITKQTVLQYKKKLKNLILER